MQNNRTQKILSYTVFGIYLLLLVWLIMFKLAVKADDIIHFRHINLIPFYYDEENGLHLREVVYNVLVFVPFGAYVTIFRQDWPFVKKAMPALLASLLLEVSQYIFALGGSDITDIITNTVGGMLGVIMCSLIKRMTSKYIAVINVACIVTGTLFAGAYAMLVYLNR